MLFIFFFKAERSLNTIFFHVMMSYVAESFEFI